jgi:hypothetical protein
MGANGRFLKDTYPDSTYGVQKGNFSSLSLDASYAYSDSGSITPYVTKQRRTRSMSNAQPSNATLTAVGAVAPTSTNSGTVGLAAGVNVWSNDLVDQDVTFGLGIKQGNLLSGNLELKGDLTYSSGRVGYSTYYITPGAGLYCNAPSLMACGKLPDVTNTVKSLKLVADYKLDKLSKVSLGYLFQKLNTTDFYYNAYVTGMTANSVMPSNQNDGSYKVNAVSLVYTYNFR